VQSGTIDSSLFSATDGIGVPDSIAASFAELFSGEVDLHRDIRRGDRFAIVYEMIYSNGYPVRSGRILAAEFLNQGRKLQAIFFEGPDGSKDYFTPSGRNMRQAFLRSPLEFSRVTSGFSSSRFHPVLQVWRAHKGTDYGAPLGTRVRSTADGVIVFAGWQNGYGKVVEVRHSGNLTTRYGHLSEFSAQTKKGARVEQGAVIGFVGMTGLASGPHLHYEFHVNGTQADPQNAVPHQRPSISAGLRDEFLRTSSEASMLLGVLSDANVTSAE
jgi:murein DD-endopeptidase MepM/ murein hydrolase activator NlpD